MGTHMTHPLHCTVLYCILFPVSCTVSTLQVKQRIIDVDTKNSLGLVGHIEELSHNALAVYWNPLDSPAKVNLAIQCLSTDFR